MATAKDTMKETLAAVPDVGEDTAEIFASAGDLTGESAPVRRRLIPAPLTNLWFLGTGLVVSIILLVVMLAIQNQRTADQARYVEMSSYMLMGSQRIAKDSREAVLGNESAFRTLADSRNSFAGVLDALDKGDPNANIKPTPDKVRPLLAPVQKQWNTVRTNVELILNQEQALLGLRDQVRAVNELSPLVLAQADEVVELLASVNTPAQKLNLAGLQRTLSQRITKDVNVFALGGASAAVAATQFGKDAKQFREINQQLRQGAGPGLNAKLDQVDETFGEMEKNISGILEKVAEFFVAQRAATIISENSDPLLENVQKLVAGYSAIVPKLGFFKIAPFVFGISAAAFLVFFVMSLVGEARERAQQSVEQNRQTQESILKLLDEMGSLADGDLTIHPEVGEQMTGAIADSINFAVKEMRGIVSRINTTSLEVARESDQTRETATQLFQASSQQAQQIEDASDELQTMARSMEDMSLEAKQSAVVAQGSVDVAKRGAGAVRRTIERLDEMREQIQDTAKRIKRLGESSQQIGDIVNLIDDIAEQTNILSLNAAIQAAMAGEAGRGFAVVADEVQRLAERSAEATKQIGDLVKTIQADTNEVVSSMEKATEGVVEGVRIADDAGRSLGEIESVSEQLSELIGVMAETAHQQSQRAATVTSHMSNIRDVSTRTSAGTRETADAVDRLSDLVRELQSSVAGFKLPA